MYSEDQMYNMTVAEIIEVLKQVDPTQKLGFVGLSPLSQTYQADSSRTHYLQLAFGHGCVGTYVGTAPPTSKQA